MPAALYNDANVVSGGKLQSQRHVLRFCDVNSNGRDVALRARQIEIEARIAVGALFPVRSLRVTIIIRCVRSIVTTADLCSARLRGSPVRIVEVVVDIL